MSEKDSATAERNRSMQKLYDDFFSPERRRQMALAYLSLCDDGYRPPSLVAETVVEWLGESPNEIPGG